MGEYTTYPQWVLDLIDTEFYELCENHSDSQKAKYCNLFCVDCTKSPFCDLCYNHELHKGHQVIQVYKSSHSPGIKIPLIRTLFDISEIQPYSINGNFIIYIGHRSSKENSNGSVVNKIQRVALSNHKRKYGEKNHKRKRRCETCQWELTTLQGSPYDYRFCSMECKVKRPKRSRQMEDGEVSASINGCEEQFCCLRKRRRRKGMPRRSPLF